MDTNILKNEFYESIKAALGQFSRTEQNNDVYALALDCDSDVGQICLRYNNTARFTERIPEYQKYYIKYGWKVYGLHGSEYDVGEFAFIEYQRSGLVKHFLDSYYYYAIGDYYGEGEPIEEIKEHYHEIFWDMVESTIQRLKPELKEIGIDAAEHIIFFCCDHDQSEEDMDKMKSHTVNSELMTKLIAKES